MATITKGNYLTTLAGADLHASGYCIVKFDTNGNAILTAAASDDIVGVLDSVQQSGPVPQSTSGGPVSIAHVGGTGTGKVVAGASISARAFLTSDANGHAITATQTAGGSQPTVRVFGRARYAANTGDLVEYEKMFFLY